MSSAESSSTNPFYSSGKLPTLPISGPFTLADKYGVIKSPSIQSAGKLRRRTKRGKTMKHTRRTKRRMVSKTRRTKRRQ